jgi:hypothetical protein
MLLFTNPDPTAVYVRNEQGKVFFLTDSMNIGSLSVISAKMTFYNNTVVLPSLSSYFYVFTFGYAPAKLEVDFIGGIVDCERSQTLGTNLIQYFLLNNPTVRILPVLIFMNPYFFLGYMLNMEAQYLVDEKGFFFIRGKATFAIVA